MKYSVNGDIMWRKSTGGVISGVAVSHQGHIFTADYRGNQLHIYTPDGTLLSSTTIASPHDVCASSSGRRILVLHEENSPSESRTVISVRSPDGHVKHRLCEVSDYRVTPRYNSLSLLDDRYMAVCVDGDIHLHYISDQLVLTGT